MKQQQDHLRDIAQIRSMMERSSRFLSLSGWAGVMAGIYALAGAWIAWSVFHFNPDTLFYDNLRTGSVPDKLLKIILLTLAILILSISTAVYYSWKKAKKRGERIWNASSRRVLENMLIPLATGGILIWILFTKDLIGLIAPCMLLFYGLALFNTSNYTYNEVKYLGIIQIVLGLISSLFIEYGLLFWSIGFGLFHIIYGIYIHFKYER